MNVDWIVEGALLCPHCTLYIDFEGTTDQLEQAIGAHRCAPGRYED